MTFFVRGTIYNLKRFDLEPLCLLRHTLHPSKKKSTVLHFLNGVIDTTLSKTSIVSLARPYSENVARIIKNKNGNRRAEYSLL